MDTSNATHWIIAVPRYEGDGKQQNEDEAAQLAFRHHDMSTRKFAENFMFEVPTLRVGTLDALMSLSDELGKVDQQIENVFKKILRSYREIRGADSQLSVEGATPSQYLEKFTWNKAKYAVGLTLQQLTSRIQEDTMGIDDDLRKKMNKFTEVQTVLAGIERKEQGTLLVKPLHDLVKPDDLVEGEFITTLLVVVPKTKEKKFMETYETMEDLAESERKAASSSSSSSGDSSSSADDVDEVKEEESDEARQAREQKERDERKLRACKNIVPRSAKKLAHDAEFGLYRMVVFKKGADVIKNICREQRYTVRHYEYDPEEAKSDSTKRDELTALRDRTHAALGVWCEATFSDAFSAWVHLKAIRVFVESVLRYGIPVNFIAILCKPRKGYRTKLRKTLGDMYSKLSGARLVDGDSGSSGADVGNLGEFYPYVYIPADLADE